MNTKYQNHSVEQVAGPGVRIDIFSGNAPVDADAASSGTLLLTFGEADRWLDASNGTAVLASTSAFNEIAVAEGTFGYARISAISGFYVVQCGAGTSATAEIRLDAGTCASGDSVVLIDATFYQGAS